MSATNGYALEDLIKDERVQKIEIETSDNKIIHAIFSDYRILENTIPENLYLYDIRHSDYDDMIPRTIENWVFVNYYGNIISKEDLGLIRKDDYITIKDYNLGEVIEDIKEFIE